jgi:hypothetical protein
MATQRLAPDAILEEINLSGAVSVIQDDPDSPDGNWLTASANNSNTSLRVSFPTPNQSLDAGSVQNIHVLVRKSVGQSGTPTASIELWESGSLISTIVGSTNITGSMVLSGSFDKSVLADTTGAGVEIRVNGVSVGGNPNTRATVEVGAIEWNVVYTAGSLFTRTSSDTISAPTDAVAGSVSTPSFTSLFACGAECNNPAHWTSTVGDVSMVTTPVKHNIRSLRIGTGQAHFRYDFAVGKRVVTSSYYVLYTAFPTVNSESWMGRTASSQSSRISYNPATGRLEGSFFAGTIGVGPVIALNTWYLIDLTVDTSTIVSTINWSVNGVAQPQGSVSQNAHDILGIRSGAFVSSDALIFIDDVVVTDAFADYPIGEHSVDLSGGTEVVNFGASGTLFTRTSGDTTSVSDAIAASVTAGGTLFTRTSSDTTSVSDALVGAITAEPPLPTIPAGYGVLLRKEFTDGVLTPFKHLVYPDDHVGEPGQYMTTFARFSTKPENVSIHDGYLDLKATRQATGDLWDASFVGTGTDGRGDTNIVDFDPPIIVRYYARMNIAHATWQAMWLYNTTWGTPEIDFYELLESGPRITLLGGPGGTVNLPAVDTAWHEFAVIYTTTFVATLIDGVEVGRISGALFSDPMALLADVTLGFGFTSIAPDATTPDPVYLHISGVTVDTYTGSLIRTISDTRSTTDAFTRLLNAARSANETLSHSDAPVRISNKTRSASDTRTTSDVFTRIINRLRTVVDTTSVTATATRISNKVRTTIDTISSSDILSRATAVRTRLVSDTRATTETLSRSTAAKVRTVTDAITGITETLVRAAILRMLTITDTVSATDTFTRAASVLSRAFADVTTLSETIVRAGTHVYVMADTVITSDAVVRATIAARLAVDNLVTSATTTMLFTRVRSFIDTLSVSESLSRAVGIIRNALDTTALSDGLFRAGFVLHRITSDSINAISDTLIRAANKVRSVVDVVTSSDSVVAQIFIGTVQLFRTASDTIITSDAISRLIVAVRTFTDTTSITDVMTRIATSLRTAHDIVMTSDIVTRLSHAFRVVADVTLVNDTVAKVGIFIRSVSDAITSASDVVIRVSNKIRALTDATAINDAVARQWQGARTFVDTLPNIVEVLSTNLRLIIVRAFSDTIVLGSDNISRTAHSLRGMIDTVATSDVLTHVVTVIRGAFDTLTTSDVVIRGGIVIRRIVGDIIVGIVDSARAATSLPAYVGEAIHAAIHHNFFNIPPGDGSSNVGGGPNRINVKQDNRKTKVR